VAEQTARARSAERVQEELRTALADAERRITEIESRPGAGRDSSFETVGSRVSEILGAAASEAAEITRRAHEKAQVLHDEAEATSVTSRAEADHYASDVRERAEREAVAITATARTEAERILADARALREAQQRADTEAYERVAAELADRQAHSEVEFATTSAANERRLASLRAEIDAATEELNTVQERASAQMDLLLTEARADATAIRDEAARIREEALQHRARVRAQLAEVRERLARALARGGENEEPAAALEPPAQAVTPPPSEVAAEPAAERLAATTEVAQDDPHDGFADVEPWSAPGSMAHLRDRGVRH
jgi:hypothetical protein